MKIIKQMVLTIYADGSTRMTERAIADRDSVNGRFVGKRHENKDPVSPSFASAFAQDAATRGN